MKRLISALLLVIPPTVNSQPADLSMTVKAKGSGDPVDGATVVAADGTYAETDPQGRAAFKGVDLPSRCKILAPGFETLQLDLTSDSPLTVYLIPQSYEAEGLEVIEERVREKVSKVVFSAAELQRAPGSGGDAVKVVQSLPGVVTAAEGSGMMYMRGSDSGENIFWVDGVPVEYLYHLGGIQSTLNPALVGDFNVFLGGFPVEYGDKLGGAIDVRLRAPKNDRIHQTYSIGNYESSFLVEGPVGDSDTDSFYVAARRSYIDFLFSPDQLNEKEEDDDEPSDEFITVPKFYDAQAVWRHTLDRGELNFRYLAAGDEVAFLNNKAANSDPELAGEFNLKMAYQTAGVDWRQQYNEQWSHSLIFSLSETSERVSIGTDPEGNPYYSDVDAQSASVHPQLHWRPSLDETYTFGLALDYATYPLKLYIAEPPAPGQIDYDYTTAPKHRIDSTIDARLAAPYMKYSRKWGDLTAGLGLRYSTFSGTGGIGDEAFSPRASLEYALSDKMLLTAAWGRFVQIPKPVYLVEGLGNPSLVYTEAEHRVMGVKYLLNPQWALQWEAYHKPMTELVVGAETSPPGNYVNEGTGESYGTDLLIKRQGGDGKLGWLSYSYARSYRTNERTDDSYLFAGDQPHTLTLVWSQPLTGEWNRWHWGLRVQAHSGQPYTPVVARTEETLSDGTKRFRPVYGDAYSERFPDYYRVDMRFDRRVLFDDSTLNFYLELQNVTFNKNVVGYDYGSKFQYVDNPRAVTSGTFMPYFGIAMTF